MAHRLVRYAALVVVGALIGAHWDALAAVLMHHPGRIAEHGSYAPLDADVTAWPEVGRTQSDETCPAYGSKELDKQRSRGGGFVIAIEQTGAFTLVYCRADYVPRIEVQANERDGAPVRPALAVLWPRKISEDDEAAFDEDVFATFLTFLNNIGYLRTVDTPRFEGAVSRAAERLSNGSPGRAAILRNLRPVARQWTEGKSE